LSPAGILGVKEARSMASPKRSSGVDLNLQIKALQQDLEDLRQRLERLENQYDQADTAMPAELDDDSWTTGSYPL
ncbi:MAG: hypothetical protein QM219_09025, partial [Bacillota bacterium]|nr:hypothetical protein [Bacillota bacterium]